jgi:hypothetical protein
VVRDLVVSLMLSIIGSFIIVVWLVSDEPTRTFLFATKTDDLSYVGIKDYKIDFKDKAILLNITLSKPLSCGEVIEILGVEDLVIRERTYSPRCKLVSPTLIIITYGETITV